MLLTRLPWKYAPTGVPRLTFVPRVEPLSNEKYAAWVFRDSASLVERNSSIASLRCGFAFFIGLDGLDRERAARGSLDDMSSRVVLSRTRRHTHLGVPPFPRLGDHRILHDPDATGRHDALLSPRGADGRRWASSYATSPRLGPRAS